MPINKIKPHRRILNKNGNSNKQQEPNFHRELRVFSNQIKAIHKSLFLFTSN